MRFDSCENFFALLAQPPISPRNRVSNQHRAFAKVRAAIKRPTTRADHTTGRRTPRLSRTDAVRAWGSPHKERAPRKLGVGCETSRGKETRLTMSPLSLPQLTHMHSKIFLTFTIKPEQYTLEKPPTQITSRRTRMKDGSRKLNVSEMPWTFRHTLPTSLTLEVPVNGAQPRVH